MIANPTPVTAAPFNGMWITNLGIFLPTEAKPKGFIAGNLLPYDGTHLLANTGTRLYVGDLATKCTTDAPLAAMLGALEVELQRLAATTAAVEYLSVMAPRPARPVLVSAKFTGGKFHQIRDCYALAATDSVFAGVFQSVMAEIAHQAGLTVTA